MCDDWTLHKKYQTTSTRKYQNKVHNINPNNLQASSISILHIIFSLQTLLRYHVCLYQKLGTSIQTYLVILVMHSAIALDPSVYPVGFHHSAAECASNCLRTADMRIYDNILQVIHSVCLLYRLFIFSLWSPRTLFVLVGLTEIPCSEQPLSKSKSTVIMDQRNIMECYLYFIL